MTTAMVPALEAGATPSNDTTRSVWECLVRDSEREASTLADAVHDGLMQSLVVIRYALAWERSHASPPASGSGADALPDPDTAVQTCLADTRCLVWHLRPRVHHADGLPDALAELAGRLVEDAGPRLDSVVEPVGLTLEQAVVVYRMAQEWARAASPGAILQLRVTRAASGDVLVETTGSPYVDGGWTSRGRHLGVHWKAMLG